MQGVGSEEKDVRRQAAGSGEQRRLENGKNRPQTGNRKQKNKQARSRKFFKKINSKKRGLLVLRTILKQRIEP